MNIENISNIEFSCIYVFNTFKIPKIKIPLNSTPELYIYMCPWVLFCLSICNDLVNLIFVWYTLYWGSYRDPCYKCFTTKVYLSLSLLPRESSGENAEKYRLVSVNTSINHLRTHLTKRNVWSWSWICMFCLQIKGGNNIRDVSTVRTKYRCHNGQWTFDLM